MFVLTVDQKGSRRLGDRVPDLLASLGRPSGLVRDFERTVGDEVQAVLADAEAVVDLALHLLRIGGWSVGIGVGPVDEPLPTSTRAGSGPAFVHARAAVERAKVRSRPVPLAVAGVRSGPASDAEAVLVLLGAVVVRRSAAGWAVVDAMVGLGDAATQDRVSAQLGISQQAVSQRLRAAMWVEERAGRPVAARLLREGER